MPAEVGREDDTAMPDPSSNTSGEPSGESLEALNRKLESHAESDAQTIISDFLDFTEYLPSDVVRSLTLIGKLDKTYTEKSIQLNDLTTTWSQLPSLPASSRPAPAALRKEISESMSQSLSSRVFAHAEAVRMMENVDRHYNKAKVLLEKLQFMMHNYPTDEQQAKSPLSSRSPQMSRAKVSSTGPRIRRQTMPRITVPGEVLAPYDIECPNLSDDSESSDDESDAAHRTPGPPQRIKLHTNKLHKQIIRAPKTFHLTPDFMSAAHAANQAALRRPPPPDAIIGSVDAPWLQLTDYELAKLRKRMKKNATWTPSDTMIARELKALSRGPDAYRLAKKQAEKEGKSFEIQIPHSLVDGSSGSQQLPAGAISVNFTADDEGSTNDGGVKPNEVKKVKREALAKMAAEEAEASARKMAETAKIFLGPNGGADHSHHEDNYKALRAQSRSGKRKRNGEDGWSENEYGELHGARITIKRSRKQNAGFAKHLNLGHLGITRETPVPPPLLTPGGSYIHGPLVQTPVPIPIPGQSSARTSATSPAPVQVSVTAGPATTTTTTITTTTAPLKPTAETPVPLPRKTSTTPIHPPMLPSNTRETRGEAAKRTQGQQSLAVPPTGHSPQPSSRGPSPSLTPAPETISRPESRGQRTGQESISSLAADRPRRASTTRNTPAPDPTMPPKKRLKRPAPGIVTTTNSGGNSAVGKRKVPPKKKAKKGKGQVAETELEDVDDEGNPIDPNEPRYCLCNRVSFGTMIQCDNVDNCKHEWFHLECVGLEAIPARTTKWYCPDCRKKLGLGEKGEVSARGVRK